LELSTVFFCKAAWLNSAFISAGKAAGVDEKEIRGLALVVASLAAEFSSQAIAEASWKSVPSKGRFKCSKIGHKAIWMRLSRDVPLGK